MIGEDGKVYRERPYPRPTPEFNEAINKLRRDLERGPKTRMTLDDDQRSELRRKLETRQAEVAKKAKDMGMTVPEYVTWLKGERAKGEMND